jgi:hypothetical protein
MTIKVAIRALSVAALVLAGYVAGAASASDVEAQQSATRVFELRTYTVPDEAKFTMLQARFRDHTTKLFERHGITNIGYWTPVDTPNTLIYIVAHKSQEDAKKNFAAFRADPEWTKVRTQTEAAGLTGVKVESKFLQPTDYSPMK